METLHKLTKETAIKEVARVASSAKDAEIAHTYEDELHFWFICCVASGMYDKEEAVEIAKVVMSTSEIDFPRHCI